MLTSLLIKRYSKQSIPALRKKAGEEFREYIRLRDRGQRCISCGNPQPSDAGHYFSAGHFPSLEFNEDNVHLQCRRCNYFLHSNATPYQKNLIKKIGQERYEQLDMLASQSKRTTYKHDRFYLIQVIETYRDKVKELKK